MTPTAAFKVGELIDDPLAMYLSDIYTIGANLAGLPGISVPASSSDGGLPIGFQLLGPPFAEEKLLRAARHVRATDTLARRAGPAMSGDTSYTTVVGLEVHVQLLTRTKLFCGCENRFNPTQPNVQTCPVCLGLPGSLPVMNRPRVRAGTQNGRWPSIAPIAPFTKWDRKQYYYPDLPKGYQISQYDLPFSSEGWLEITTGEAGPARRIGIIRAHLEEDAGKNLHDETGRGGDSLIDLNRAGTPLLEIVSKPDLRSGREAHAYLDELKLLLTYLEVSDCNMQEGSLRCDANVNLHIPAGRRGKRSPRPLWRSRTSTASAASRRPSSMRPSVDSRNGSGSGHKLGDVRKETRGWDTERARHLRPARQGGGVGLSLLPDPDLVPVTVQRGRRSGESAASSANSRPPSGNGSKPERRLSRTTHR